jgi:hypothetical protein
MPASHLVAFPCPLTYYTYYSRLLAFVARFSRASVALYDLLQRAVRKGIPILGLAALPDALGLEPKPSLSRGSGVRISPGAPLISLESNTCSDFGNRFCDSKAIQKVVCAVEVLVRKYAPSRNGGSLLIRSGG